MLSKKKLLQSLKDLPDKFPVEDVLDRIMFLQKIENGLEQSLNNSTLSTKEAKSRLKKWLKSELIS